MPFGFKSLNKANPLNFFNKPLNSQTANDVGKYVGAILYGRNDYQPKVRDILEKYGDQKLVSAEVRRTPLGSVLMTALDVVSLGRIAKNNPYDKLFHLSLVVKLETGETILIEKNEVINMDLEPIVVDKTESKEVPLYRLIKLNDLMQNTRDRMGDNFFIYSARNCNCQDFILNILLANGLDTPELIDFVKQDSIKIFGNLVYLRKFSNTLTDIAGRANVIFNGYGELSKKNGLSNVDLCELLHGVSNFNGAFMKDELPSKLKNGWYIINLESHVDGNGTHWCCFKYGKNLEYYDPFGFPPPIEVMEHVGKKPILWNAKQIQDVKSTACGFFCVARITSKMHFKQFLDYFSNDTNANDIKLKQMLVGNWVN